MDNFLDFDSLICSGYCNERLTGKKVQFYTKLRLEELLLRDKLDHMSSVDISLHHSLEPVCVIYSGDSDLRGKEKLCLYAYCEDCWKQMKKQESENRTRVFKGADHANLFLPLSLMAERCYPYVFDIYVPNNVSVKPWKNEYKSAAFDLDKQMKLYKLLKTINDDDEKKEEFHELMDIPESYVVLTHNVVPGMFSLPFYLDLRSFYYYYCVANILFTQEEKHDDNNLSRSSAMESTFQFKKKKAELLKNAMTKLQLKNKNSVRITITDVSESHKNNQTRSIKIHFMFDTSRFLDEYINESSALSSDIFKHNIAAIIESTTDEKASSICKLNGITDDNIVIRDALMTFTDKNFLEPHPVQCVSSVKYTGSKTEQNRSIAINSTDDKKFILMYSDTTGNVVTLYDIDTTNVSKQKYYPLMVSAHPDDVNNAMISKDRIESMTGNAMVDQLHTFHQFII